MKICFCRQESIGKSIYLEEETQALELPALCDFKTIE